MEQPYIFKKQLFTIGILVVILSLLYIDANFIWFNVALMYLVLVLVETFLPSLPRFLKYPPLIHELLYYSPMLVPIIIGGYYIKFSLSMWGKSMFLGILSGCILLFANKSKFIKNINRVYTNTGFTFKEYWYQNFDLLLAIFAEELFFRYFLITYLDKNIGFYSVLISSFLFVYAHIINRWANKMFTYKSYLYIFVLGFLLGMVFWYTHTLSGCLLGHFIYNSSEFITNWKKYTAKEENLFNNDYGD